MKTILGTPIHKDIRAVLYLCDYTGEELIIRYEGLFTSTYDALQAYSNIKNPASQLATGNDEEALKMELDILHSRMKNINWVKKLNDYL